MYFTLETSFVVTVVPAILMFLACNDHSTEPTLSSPDGVIAFSITPSNDNNEIYIMNADGSGRTQLTNRPGRDAGPAWSPDATQIAFYTHSTDERTWSIYVIDANGGNLRKLTDTEGVYDNSPTWSPDGTNQQRLTHTTVHAIQPVWRPLTTSSPGVIFEV